MAIFGALGAAWDERSLAAMARSLARRLPVTVRADAPAASLCGETAVSVDGVLFAGTGVLFGTTWDEVLRDVVRRGFVAAVRHLAGAFAVAAFDARSRTTWLARDATGQRALYVAAVPGGMAFASEAKALHVRADVPVDLDPLALARYLSFAYVPGEATLARAVRALPPGVAIAFDERGGERERHVFFHPREPLDLRALEAELASDPTVATRYARQLRACLETVVDDHLAATDALGPPAAFLSGGVDSSLVVALAARAGRTPTTLSMSFGDALPNELVYSRMVADHVGAPHHVLTLDAPSFAEGLDEATYLLDVPIGDPLTVPNRALARHAAALGFQRVLNGEGGDPCFGGPKNVPMLLASWYGDEPRERAYARSYQRFFDDLPRLFTPETARALEPLAPVEAAFAPVLDDEGIQSFLNRMQTVNLLYKGAGLILPKVEKAYGASGLTPLSPLSDRRVAELAWSIPPTLKLRGNVEKLVLKEAVRDLLPLPILERKKSGMLVPVHPWLQGPLGPLAEDLLGEATLRRRGLFAPGMVRELRAYRGSAQLRGFYGAKLWLLCTLEAWMRLFVDGGARRFLTDDEPSFRPARRLTAE